MAEHPSTCASSSRVTTAEYILTDEDNSSKRTLSSNNYPPQAQGTLELPDYALQSSTGRPLSRSLAWIERILDRYPKVHKVWFYVRGPRPKIDLPGALVHCIHPFSLNPIHLYRTLAGSEPYAAYHASYTKSFIGTSLNPWYTKSELFMAFRRIGCRVHYRTSVLLTCTVFSDTSRLLR
jgi:hypothetical protein